MTTKTCGNCGSLYWVYAPEQNLVAHPVCEFRQLKLTKEECSDGFQERIANPENMALVIIEYTFDSWENHYPERAKTVGVVTGESLDAAQEKIKEWMAAEANRSTYTGYNGLQYPRYTVKMVPKY